MDVLKIDYTSPTAAEELVKSFRKTGFAIITNHPLSKNTMKEVYSQWGEFFASKEKDNFLFSREDDVQAGYFPMNTENAKGVSVPDIKEFYHFYPWGKTPENLKALTNSLYMQLGDIGLTLLKWLDDATPKEVTKQFSMPLTDMVKNSENTLLRILHYPPIEDDVTPGAVRAAAHGDINFITLLPAATESGLQTQDVNGDWHDVSCDFGDIAINAADMLQECTGGYYPSTIHRVLNPTPDKMKTSRYSTPLFVHAHSDVKLSDRYTMLEYLKERLEEIGLY